MSRRMVYFQERFPKLTETFIRAEIAELHRRGHDVRVLTFSRDDDLLRTVCFPPIVEIVPGSLDIDGYRANLIRAAAALEASYMHVHWVTEAARFVLSVAESLSLPFGFTCHAADLWLRGNRLEPEVLGMLGRHPLLAAAAVEGTVHRDYLRWCGVPEERIVITPNAVDESTLPAFKGKAPSTVQRLISVGRPVAKKGFLAAIDAVRLLRLSGYEVTLEILGGADKSSPYGELLSRYAEPFPFIMVSGIKSNRETLERMREADVLIMPSMVAENGDSDGVPTVLAEAMLMGLPVVATDVGSVRDLVIDGSTGYLARSGDPVQLAEKIRELSELVKRPEEAELMLLRAREQARKRGIHASVNSLLLHLERTIGRFN